MKTIRIEQPYASLVCAGIQTELFIDQKIDFRGKVLVYACGQPFDDYEAEKTMPRNQYVLLVNAMKFDALPGQDKDIPLNCVIGVVDITDCRQAEAHHSSIWYKEGCRFCLFLSKAKEFDNSLVVNSSSKLFYDLPYIDQKNLPSLHKPFRIKGGKTGSMYYIKLKDSSLDRILKNIFTETPYHPGGFNSVHFHYQKELGLSIEDQVFLDTQMKLLCFESDKRILPLKVHFGTYGFSKKDHIEQIGNLDYLNFSIYWSTNQDPFYGYVPKIFNFEEFDRH